MKVQEEKLAHRYALFICWTTNNTIGMSYRLGVNVKLQEESSTMRWAWVVRQVMGQIRNDAVKVLFNKRKYT